MQSLMQTLPACRRLAIDTPELARPRSTPSCSARSGESLARRTASSPSSHLHDRQHRPEGLLGHDRPSSGRRRPARSARTRGPARSERSPPDQRPWRPWRPRRPGGARRCSTWGAKVIEPMSPPPLEPSSWRMPPVSMITRSTNASSTGSVDVDPLDRHAGLAGVLERTPDRTAGRPVEVGVRADDHRVLAAELEQHRGQRVRCGGHDPLAGAHRAGEHDLVDAAAHQRLARRAAAGDHLDEVAPRSSSNSSPMARPTVGVTSDGFSTTGVAGEQRGHQRRHRQGEGVVPRADHADRRRWARSASRPSCAPSCPARPTAAAAAARRAWRTSPWSRTRPSARW